MSFLPKNKASDIPSVLPENPTRRNFLKLLGIGGAAIALNVVTNNVISMVDSTKSVTRKKTKLGDNFSFSETKSKTIIYDETGEEVLIFDKTV